MKTQTKENGSTNDDWATPNYLLDAIREEFGEYFDPCPLRSRFNGLTIPDWANVNYVNPPYNVTDKPKFIKKAYEEFKKGNTCIVLVPATTEVKWFHELVVPNAEVRLLRQRVKFKGINSKGVYVTNKSGQSGSMLIIFKPGITPRIIPYTYHEPKRK